MVEIELTDEALVVHVKGMDKLWAAKSSLAIPLSHIAGVEPGVDEEAKTNLDKSIRVGTHLGGVITAGRYYNDGKVAFWDIHKGGNAITIKVIHDDYTHLVVEVPEPAKTIADIRARLSGPKAPLPPARVV